MDINAEDLYISFLNELADILARTYGGDTTAEGAIAQLVNRYLRDLKALEARQ